MTIGKPYLFRRYFQDADEIAKIESHGLRPTRIVQNDGSVPISGTDEDGETHVIAYVQPRIRRTRKTAYNAPDDERDAIAERIVAALNAAEA